MCLDRGNEVEVTIGKGKAGYRTMVDRHTTVSHGIAVGPQRRGHAGARVIQTAHRTRRSHCGQSRYRSSAATTNVKNAKITFDGDVAQSPTGQIHMALAHLPEEKPSQQTMRFATLTNQIKGPTDHHYQEKDAFHHHSLRTHLRISSRLAEYFSSANPGYSLKLTCARRAHFRYTRTARPTRPTS